MGFVPPAAGGAKPRRLDRNPTTSRVATVQYHRGVGAFPGGSAWAMARDIAGGYVTVTDRTFFRLQSRQVDQLVFEIQRRLRETRGQQPDLADVDALRARNQVIQRLNAALRIAEASRRKRRT